MSSADPATVPTPNIAASSLGTTFPPKPRRLESGLRRAWLLLLLDRDAEYGYELRRQLEASGLSIEPTAVYRTLRKLESDGCVSSAWGKSEAGPRRRLYHLTPAGRDNLVHLTETVTVARDLYDMFLRAREQPPRQTDDAAPADRAAGGGGPEEPDAC
jgi:PadR family transcriptional regulator PadR